jgi:hypothetical protein
MPFYACFIGDSLTDAQDMFDLTPADYRVHHIKQAIDGQYGTDITARRFGIAGQTTCQILARARIALIVRGIPDLVSLYAGANDPLRSSRVSGNAATTTFIPLVAQPNFEPGHGMAVGGSVIIDGESRKIGAIADGAIILASPLSAAPADYMPVIIDTRANLVEIVRIYQAMRAPQVTRVVLHEMHMKNWSIGGDGMESEDPAYAGIRIQQRLARDDIAAMPGVELAYVDNLTAMRALIAAGVETLNSDCWATSPNNQHLNCVRQRGGMKPGGQDVLAANEIAAIHARPGWISAIRAAG